jgi:hypothetical protein
MSPFDVPPDEMGLDPNFADEQLDAVLSGHPAARVEQLDLARFVDDLRATFPADAPATEAHLAAIMETTHLFADNGDPVARPVSNADAPVAQVSRLPKRRENRMKDHKWRILVLRVTAPIVALFTVLGIMGSAGALPRGLQRLTSHAAGLVGFELPSGEDGEAGDDQGENLDDQGDTEKDDSTTVEGDQGENDNSQGDSTSVDPTNQDDQGDSTDTSTSTEGDQGENDNSQGDSTSVDPTNQDDQGENDQGSTTNQDDQGDNSQDEGSGGSSQDDQGDNSGNTSSDDSGSGSSGSGSGDNNQD